MKTIPFLFISAILSISAAEYQVKLNAVPGDEQVYFLDLSKIKADSSTFRLTTPAGQTVPFSFDMRIESPDFSRKIQPDGFRTWSAAPAEQNRFLTPGWLSFKSVKGARQYIFTFRDGMERTLERPNPAVRAWWIEQSCNQGFQNTALLYCKKDQLTPLPEGGRKITGVIRFRQKGMPLTAKAAGRRILGLLRVSGKPGNYNFSIQYRSAPYPNAAALNPNFKLTEEKPTDICVEGMIAKNPEKAVRSLAYPVWISAAKQELTLYSLRVQLPPHMQEITVLLPTDILNAGDSVRLQAAGLDRENILPFVSGGIRGYSVGAAAGKISIVWRLLDTRGKTMRSGTDILSAGQLKPGKYTLETKLMANENVLRIQTFPILIQQGPFTGH